MKVNKMNDFEIEQKKQKLIEELQRFYKEEGFVPYSYMMNIKDGYPSAGVYQYYFGSFNNALEIAGLEINKIGKLDGTERCTNCNKYANEIVGFSNWYYYNNKRHCNKCGHSNGLHDYVKGQLDIHSNVGRGRAGEITVIKALKIGNEFDCNKISCGYFFDMYNEKYGKIDVKTSVLNSLWTFKFRTKKVANTYICLGMSSDTKQIEHVWNVPNEGKFRDLTTFSISNGNLALRNHEKWEVNTKIYNEAWQEMLVKYVNGDCNIFCKKEGE